MARIKTVSMESAEGVVKEGYEMFQKMAGMIPKPMEVMSVSPALFELQLKRLGYYAKHPNLGFALLAHIRYLVSLHLNYAFCTDFNKMTLKRLGADDETLEKMGKDPSAALLEENEKEMLCFVIQAVQDPASITDQDVNSLRESGWTDMDMVDALSQGVGMIDHSIMMQVFDIDQTCII